MAEEVFYDWSKPAFEGKWMAQRRGGLMSVDKTGHFTQAVWKNSRFVGCYTTKCNPGTVFEASYGVSRHNLGWRAVADESRSAISRRVNMTQS